MFKLSLILSFLLLSIAPGLGEVEQGGRKIEISPWVIPESGSYRGQVGFPGETVVFNYTSPHDVWLVPSGNCDDLINAVQVGDAPMTGDYVQVEYTIKEEDAGKTLTFICGVQGHCGLGQVIQFEIKEIPEVDYFYPQWNIGNAPYAEVDAYNSQTISFEYSGSHNVYIFPAATADDVCNPEGAIMVGDTGAGPAEYTLMEGMGDGCNATEVYFVCYAKMELKHCGRGQYVKFNVYPSEECLEDNHDSCDEGHDGHDGCEHDDDGAIGMMSLKWTSSIGMLLLGAWLF